MSSAKHTPPSQRRRQLVNAALLGAVVVVIGFASGIGVETNTSAQQPSAPKSPSSAPPAPRPTPQTTTRPPIDYVGIALPPPATTAAPSPTATPTETTPPATPTHATTPSPTTKPRTTPAPTCSPDLVGGLLDTVLGIVAPGGTSGSGSGLLPLVGGLLDGLGLGGTTSTTAGATPTLPTATSACGNDLLGGLPLLGGTG